ncbi:MAG: hypothetical protein ACODAD_14935, partial [Planctomycetota bacterium]
EGVRMESCLAQAVLPLVGLTADKITRDRYIFQAVEGVRMESCLAQAVLPLVGVTADKITRDRRVEIIDAFPSRPEHWGGGQVYHALQP